MLYGRPHCQCTVTSLTVVEDLKVLEDRVAQFNAGPPLLSAAGALSGLLGIPVRKRMGRWVAHELPYLGADSGAVVYSGGTDPRPDRYLITFR
jgi:hypothetical protein